MAANGFERLRTLVQKSPESGGEGSKRYIYIYKRKKKKKRDMRKIVKEERRGKKKENPRVWKKGWRRKRAREKR